VKVGPAAVPPGVVTETAPVVPPTGAVVVMEVALEAVTTAAVPLNLTVLLAAVGSKLVPVRVTVMPAGPASGLIEVRVRSHQVGEYRTVGRTATRGDGHRAGAGPDGGRDGKEVLLAALTTAPAPLNLTVLLAWRGIQNGCP
jgi:hypothetical protein